MAPKGLDLTNTPTAFNYSSFVFELKDMFAIFLKSLICMNMETTSGTNEKIFFQDANVTVTQSRFIVDGKTYAMRNISSVSNYRIVKSKAIPVLITAIGILCLFDNALRGYGAIMALVGGIWWYLLKDEYSVRINSNSGESNAFRSKDEYYVQTIVDAVANAIVFRG